MLQESTELADPDGDQGGQDEGDGVHRQVGQLRRAGHRQHRDPESAVRGGLRHLQEIRGQQLGRPGPHREREQPRQVCTH